LYAFVFSSVAVSRKSTKESFARLLSILAEGRTVYKLIARIHMAAWVGCQANKIRFTFPSKHTLYMGNKGKGHENIAL
jgi:hypothetical protein